MNRIEKIVELVRIADKYRTEVLDYEVTLQNETQTQIVFFDEKETFSWTRSTVTKALEDAGELYYISWNVTKRRIQLCVFWYNFK